MPRPFFLILALAACGEVSTAVDAFVADTDAATPDMSPMPDPVAPARRKATASTSGGGAVASGAHRIRVRIGAPQPAGVTASANHHIITGPGAMP